MKKHTVSMSIIQNGPEAQYRAVCRRVAYPRHALAMALHTPDTKRADKWVVSEHIHQPQDRSPDKLAKSPHPPFPSTNPGELNPTHGGPPMPYRSPEWWRGAIDLAFDKKAHCIHADLRDRASPGRCQRRGPGGRQRRAKRGLPGVDSRYVGMLAS